jgi:hypothetical protein
LWRIAEAILETKRSREALGRLGGKQELRQLEQLAAVMPPPPTASPAPVELNMSSQRDHNREGYDRRVRYDAMGATLSH